MRSRKQFSSFHRKKRYDVIFIQLKPGFQMGWDGFHEISSHPNLSQENLSHSQQFFKEIQFCKINQFSNITIFYFLENNRYILIKK